MKNASISHLSEHLRHKIQQDQRAIEDVTRRALNAHADSLRRLSDDALNTMRDVIHAHNRRLRRMLWASVLLPVLAATLGCLLMIAAAGAWLYLRADGLYTLYTTTTATWRLADGRQALVITDERWQTCTSQSGRVFPCRILEEE